MPFFENLINSFIRAINLKDDLWKVIIADDGSTDGTIEYIESLAISNTPITLIKNNRQGIHHQFNTIVNELEKMDFDYCFKCDDDIKFIQLGWESVYINAIKNSGYDHLCHFDPKWRPIKNLKKPIIQDNIIGYCEAKDVQGAFFTLTPAVIHKVGYMDTQNFGFRGVGHVDYTMRACRVGFNDIKNPFDVKDSDQYITHQSENYVSALNKHVQNALESDLESKRKYELIQDSSRIYIPFYKQVSSMNSNDEKELLLKRLEILETEKKWYEKTYGHQPRWFIRLGKILNIISSVFLKSPK